MPRSASFKIVLYAVLANMIAPFSIDTYLPSFPSLEDFFSVERAAISATMGAYLFTFALTMLIWGPLIDRFGRKSTAIVALLAFSVVSAGCALTAQFESFFVFRLLQGVMAGGAIIGARAMIRDHFPPQQAQKMMALIMMLFAAAPAIAPILGGFLEVHFGWQSIFWFLATYGLTLALYLANGLKETQHPDHVQSIALKRLAASYWETLKHPKFIWLTLSQAFLFGGFFIYIAGSASLIYDHLRLGPKDFWIQFVPMVGGMILGSIVVHRFSDAITPKRLIQITFILASMATTANIAIHFLAAPSILNTIAPITLYAFAMALALPVLSIMGLDCWPHKRGMASALQSLLQMGTAALVASIITPFVHSSLLLMALSQLLYLSLALLFWKTANRSE